MQLPRPVVPSQRYSPSSDYTYDTHSEVLPTTRQPLGESTGNVQAHSLSASALCYHNQSSISPPLHPILTPPIIPTQAYTSSYGTSLRSGRSLQRNVSLQESPMAYSRGSKNPFYAHKNFADYRNKVMQKELEKENPAWPLWLEDAFLDALLLVPRLGRKKFCSKGILYGRNMLITEYLWIYAWLLYPPQEDEIIPKGKEREKWGGPDEKPHPKFRTRKQVSSHIQVMKAFFIWLPVFHFIFSKKEDAKGEKEQPAKDDEDGESFKNNRILIAITDGLLPDERPNYEYFARLLNSENDIFLRPKQCWIFVSHSKVSITEKHVMMDDGSTKKEVSGKTPDEHILREATYPHLRLNEGKEYKDLLRRGDRRSVLLHEYTKKLSLTESSSVKEISKEWDHRFPELKEKLMKAIDGSRPSDERTSRCVLGPCDVFHFKVVLDLHATSKFPEGSELNGMVELAISRSDLYNHSWQSITSVVKPSELYLSEQESDFWEQHDRVEVIVSHRAGCNGVSRCECAGRASRDSISVPFPAHSWANTFIKLAPYVNADRERQERERAAREAGSLRGRAEREAARVKKEHEAARVKKEHEEAAASHQKSGAGGSSRTPGPRDLLSQVAMYQEIWSSPNDSRVSVTTEGSKRSWTRRAVLLWTFDAVHEVIDVKKKTSTTVPAETHWRHLTKVDPTSQYHQEHAYLSGSPSVISRDNVMSPQPSFAHHVNAVMHENFSTVVPSKQAQLLGQRQPRPHHLYAGLESLPSQDHSQPQFANYNHLLDDFSNGLATPPSTASLQSSYAHSFDDGRGGNGENNDIGGGDSLHHHLSFISDATSTTATDLTVGTLTGDDHHHDASNDAFLANLGVTSYDDSADSTLQGWATSGNTNAGAGGLGDLTDTHWDETTAGFIDSHVSGVSWGTEPTGLTSTTMIDSQWAANVHDVQDDVSIGSQPQWTPPAEDDAGGARDECVPASQAQDHEQDFVHHHQDPWGSCSWHATDSRDASSSWDADDGGHDIVDDTVRAGDLHHEADFSLGGTGLTPLKNHNLALSLHHDHDHQQHHNNNNTNGDSNGQNPVPSRPQMIGRKRSRTESLGDDADDLEGDGIQALGDPHGHKFQALRQSMLQARQREVENEQYEVALLGAGGGDFEYIRHHPAHSIRINLPASFKRMYSHPPSIGGAGGTGGGRSGNDNVADKMAAAGGGGGSVESVAPTAVMDDGLQGFL